MTAETKNCSHTEQHTSYHLSCEKFQLPPGISTMGSRIKYIIESLEDDRFDGQSQARTNKSPIGG